MSDTRPHRALVPIRDSSNRIVGYAQETAPGSVILRDPALRPVATVTSDPDGATTIRDAEGRPVATKRR